METETISSYDKSTSQKGLGEDNGIKKSANHVDSSENHVNHDGGIESERDKDDLDDSRSDEEEEDVPLIVQGSKSDGDHSDDELSHLDLHNEDDDEEDIESEHKTPSNTEETNTQSHSSSPNQVDGDKVNSIEEHQEDSSVNEQNVSKLSPSSITNEDIPPVLTNGDHEILEDLATKTVAEEKNGSDEKVEQALDEIDGAESNEPHDDGSNTEQIIDGEKHISDDSTESATETDNIPDGSGDKSNHDDAKMTKETLASGHPGQVEDNKPESSEEVKSTEDDESSDKKNDTGVSEKEDAENKKVEESGNVDDRDKDNETDKEKDGTKVNELGNTKEGDGNQESNIANTAEKVDEADKGEEKNEDNQDHSEKVDDGVKEGNTVKEGIEEKDGTKTTTVPEENSLLKQTLSRPPETKEPDGEEDIEMDDDFDPSLLCPDIAMEVDEAPVITNTTEPPSTDATGSSSLYEPIFSTVVDEFTGAEASVQLTPEEENLRIETFSNNPVQFTKIHCTACNVHLGSALDGQFNRFVHPLLKVLICKNCYHFYTSGEFEKDEDGSELYCRWCGQGGQVMCCSNCEMVFCKKCIRINFDRKTIAQIRDSEEWICFRCNPSQITHLKVHCAEFMEYVRRETSRASTLENAVEFMKEDHARCCSTQKKKAPEAASEVPKKKKRKTSVDPDFDPVKERESPKPSFSGTQKPETITVTPSVTDTNQNGSVVQANAPTAVKVTPSTPNTVPYKPRHYGPRPRVQIVSANSGQSPRNSTSSGPGYIKIIPRAAATASTPTRNRAPYVRPAINKPAGGSAKHEWFERTVIAAARVNSNLSYTLTQLNRAQANATSVELLAVVHNKLQEILSSSINSLISIRKKLRLEFIEGIKNTRFPPNNRGQATVPKPSTSNNSADQDDDVIFIDNAASNAAAGNSVTTNNKTASNAIGSMSTPPPLAPLKKVTATSNNSERSNSPATNSKTVDNNGQPKGFLRVKSLNALLNVSSECITIPDDGPASATKPAEKSTSTPTTVDDDDDDDDVKIIEKPIEQVDLTDSENEEPSFDLAKDPTPEIKRMKNVCVNIKRLAEMEKMIKERYSNSNGDVTV